MLEPLLLIHGADPYLVAKAAQEARSALCQDLISDLGLEEFKASADLDAIERSLATPPFLAIRRVVMIWDPPQLGGGKRSPREIDRLLATLASRAETTATCLVVRSQLPATSVLIKGVRSLGGEVRPIPRPTGSDLRVYVERRLQARGLPLSAATVRLLLEVAAHDLGWLEMELEKLELYQQQGQPISDEEAVLLVTPAPPPQLYRVTDALFESPATAGPKLQAVLSRPDIQPPMVVGALARTLRDLIVYSDPQANPPAKPVPPWLQERLARQLKQVGRERARRWLVELADLDWATRAGLVDASSGLEAILARIAVESQGSRPVRTR
ncbi:MAG TPA: hypothetical protein VMV23_05630 [Candidatus Nanopelagicaceae bacterium]|nr:hypothetical protein [Candidatus Nanopelagicaceae bacterium]